MIRRARSQHAGRRLSELTAVLRARPGALPMLAGRTAEQADSVIQLARRHGVEAWLAGCAPLTEPAWAELARQRPRFLAAQARSLAAVREFGGLADRAGVRWLVLKGPALAHSVYPRPDLRHYVDLDLLVAPTDFERVLAELEAAGYHLVDRNWPLLARERPGELRLRSPRGVLLDLHWSIFNDATRRASFDAPTADLLDRSRVLAAGFPALSAADQLVHVGLHAALSGANRLGWLLDAHLAAGATGDGPSDDRPDWPAVLAAAGRIGAGPSLAVVLGRTSRLLSTAVAREVLVELAGGRGWLALAGGLDRLSPLQDDPARPALARSVARSVRATGPSSARELTRHAWLWVRSGAGRRYVRPAWLDADNPASAMLDVPDPAARQRYLAAVADSR
ncbi:MAG TPA: nucleotidyltransferase family protein [Jatrophihabitans sp.]|nr:nucleotidyltransferase family protein [Jatrophihabitans sp.]